MKNADMPAMPTYELNGQNVLQDTSYGLTKREHFAGLALNGLMSDASAMFEMAPEGEDPARYFAKTSVNLADALLAELESTQP